MRNRYPGPQAFTIDDAKLFYGRGRESKELYELILVERLSVLFSKSGLGKTSLLNAGVAPKLLKKTNPHNHLPIFEPIFIRFNDTAISPVKETCHKLGYVKADDKDSALWSALKDYNQTHQHIPVLIFDQFEELFTLHDPKIRLDFINQLAYIVNKALPPAIRQTLEEGIINDTLSSKEVKQLEAPPKCRIVLAIRSDMLSFLHQVSPQIPAILNNRYELKALNYEGAKNAIVKPAEAKGEFNSPPFKYDKTALENILQKLSVSEPVNEDIANYEEDPIEPKSISNKNVKIEAFQLQLVCGSIENKIIREGTEAMPKDKESGLTLVQEKILWRKQRHYPNTRRVL